MQAGLILTTLALVLLGQTTSAEEEPLPVSLEHARLTFSALDLDQDHSLEFDELSRTGLREKSFQKFDADWSGTWSEADFFLYYEHLLEEAGRPLAIDLQREVARIRSRREPRRMPQKKTSKKPSPKNRDAAREEAGQPERSSDASGNPGSAAGGDVSSAEKNGVESASDEVNVGASKEASEPESTPARPRLILAEQGPQPTPAQAEPVSRKPETDSADPETRKPKDLAEKPESAEKSQVEKAAPNSASEPQGPTQQTRRGSKQNLLERAREAQRRRNERKALEQQALEEQKNADRANGQAAPPKSGGKGKPGGKPRDANKPGGQSPAPAADGR